MESGVQALSMFTNTVASRNNEQLSDEFVTLLADLRNRFEVSRGQILFHVLHSPLQEQSRATRREATISKVSLHYQRFPRKRQGGA